jgi:hypothetical protein
MLSASVPLGRPSIWLGTPPVTRPELVVVVRDERGKHLSEIGALVRVREH